MRKRASIIFQVKVVFDTPKAHPTYKIPYLDIIAEENESSLDCFAGSGTTAQAVLALNKEDGGNRKFILVEVEDYADKITAERVRRIIRGVPTADDEKAATWPRWIVHLLWAWTTISIHGLLKGTALPDYATLASYVFYTATGSTLAKPPKKPQCRLPDRRTQRPGVSTSSINPTRISCAPTRRCLIANALKRSPSPRLQAHRALVFAAGKFMSQNELAAQRIEFSRDSPTPCIACSAARGTGTRMFINKRCSSVSASILHCSRR